jgi:hypothetical protein
VRRCADGYACLVTALRRTLRNSEAVVRQHENGDLGTWNHDADRRQRRVVVGVKMMGPPEVGKSAGGPAVRSRGASIEVALFFLAMTEDETAEGGGRHRKQAVPGSACRPYEKVHFLP